MSKAASKKTSVSWVYTSVITEPIYKTCKISRWKPKTCMAMHGLSVHKNTYGKNRKHIMENRNSKVKKQQHKQRDIFFQGAKGYWWKLINFAIGPHQAEDIEETRQSLDIYFIRLIYSSQTKRNKLIYIDETWHGDPSILNWSSKIKLQAG